MAEGGQAASSSTSPAPLNNTFGSTGMAMLAMTPRYALDASDGWRARTMTPRTLARPAAADEGQDPHEALRGQAEANFFASNSEKERYLASRHVYPRKKAAEAKADPLTGERDDTIHRRIPGFGLGFEKIFSTTSVKLPVSAYTIFVELHLAHNGEAYSRCFNGLQTLFDLKKWVYEKLLVPMNAYELSYAEPGKAALTDSLRLLTTSDSLDTRTLATTRAVHGMYKGIPGVHSIGDIGVTRLYMRLKCRTCGDLLNSLQTCRKLKSFGHIEPKQDASYALEEGMGATTSMVPKVKGNAAKAQSGGTGRMQAEPPSNAGVPGADPSIEDCWYRPDQKKHCLFHTRGYEYFEAARTHGGHAALASIYISCGKEPSKKLKLGQESQVGSRGAPVKISY